MFFYIKFYHFYNPFFLLIPQPVLGFYEQKKGGRLKNFESGRFLIFFAFMHFWRDQARKQLDKLRYGYLESNTSKKKKLWVKYHRNRRIMY